MLWRSCDNDDIGVGSGSAAYGGGDGVDDDVGGCDGGSSAAYGGDDDGDITYVDVVVVVVGKLIMMIRFVNEVCLLPALYSTLDMFFS